MDVGRSSAVRGDEAPLPLVVLVVLVMVVPVFVPVVVVVPVLVAPVAGGMAVAGARRVRVVVPVVVGRRQRPGHSVVTVLAQPLPCGGHPCGRHPGEGHAATAAARCSPPPPRAAVRAARPR